MISVQSISETYTIPLLLFTIGVFKFGFPEITMAILTPIINGDDEPLILRAFNLADGIGLWIHHAGSVLFIAGL